MNVRAAYPPGSSSGDDAPRGSGAPPGSPERLVGAALRRTEDHRFVTGRGRYVGDVLDPALAHAVVVRSTVAHARLERIDAAAALRHELELHLHDEENLVVPLLLESGAY